MLRSVARYLRQAGIPFSDRYMEQTLLGARGRRGGAGAALPRALRSGRRPRRAPRPCVAEIEAAIDAVDSLDEDRILRGFLSPSCGRCCARTTTCRARSRTCRSSSTRRRSRWCRCRSRASRSSCTRRASRACTCAAARSRAAACAGRDRREDFRTEILGLMKAQMVKNALIVPVGAKGGFVVKRAGDDVVANYTTFISALLDITDTIARRRGRAARARRAPRRRRPVPRRRRRQGHGDVLGHRQRRRAGLRLLARRRVRLRRLGRLRPQGDGHHGALARGCPCSATSASSASTSRREDFTVAGIGDMSGDVFGNGMLLSRAHPARGRVRPPPHLPRPRPGRGAHASPSGGGCSTLARSSWADYDTSLISEGGGVFPRTAKSIPLSPQVQAALDVAGRPADAERADPGDPARARRPALERRHRHLRQGAHGDARRRRRQGQRRACASTATTCARRSSARAATSASRSAGGSSSRSAAGASTPTRSTTPAASTAPTTRSTSRSCSTRSWPTAT